MKSRHDAYWRNCFFGQTWTERRICSLDAAAQSLRAAALEQDLKAMCESLEVE